MFRPSSTILRIALYVLLAVEAAYLLITAVVFWEIAGLFSDQWPTSRGARIVASAPFFAAFLFISAAGIGLFISGGPGTLNTGIRWTAIGCVWALNLLALVAVLSDEFLDPLLATAACVYIFAVLFLTARQLLPSPPPTSIEANGKD